MARTATIHTPSRNVEREQKLSVPQSLAVILALSVGAWGLLIIAGIGFWRVL